MASVLQHNLQRTNLEAIINFIQFSFDHVDLTKSRPDTINTRPREAT